MQTHAVRGKTSLGLALMTDDNDTLALEYAYDAITAMADMISEEQDLYYANDHGFASALRSSDVEVRQLSSLLTQGAACSLCAVRCALAARGHICEWLRDVHEPVHRTNSV